LKPDKLLKPEKDMPANEEKIKKMQAVLDAAECLYTLEDIEKELDRMGEEITQKLQNSNPIIISVMIGALIPTAYLLMRLKFPLEVDYIHATRYQGSIRGGDLHWLVEPRHDLANRTVLVVDDIMDGGLTLSAIIDYCLQNGAKEVFSAVMVNKKRKREAGAEHEPDFIGLHTDDRYLIGFGLDYEEYLRNVTGIYAVAPEHQ
jgi:hypoxanthine phosphoribosyltransferase